MGVEYGLYDKTAKEYIWLGKKIWNARDEGAMCFQMDNILIAKFLATRNGDVVLEFSQDTTDTPDFFEEGWHCVYAWAEDHWRVLEHRPAPN